MEASDLLLFLIAGEDTRACSLWCYCTLLSPYIGFITCLITFYNIFEKHENLYVLMGITLWLINSGVVTYFFFEFPPRPHQRVGPFVRSTIQVTSVLGGVILGLYCALDSRPVSSASFILFNILLVMVTIHLHALAQLMNAAADISLVDVLLGALMQVVMANVSAGDNLYAWIAGVVSCGGIIFYSYWSYSEACCNSKINCDTESSVVEYTSCLARSRDNSKIDCNTESSVEDTSCLARCRDNSKIDCNTESNMEDRNDTSCLA